MQSGGVLVLGSRDESANTGLNADERAITAQGVPVTSVSTGSPAKSTDGHISAIEAIPSVSMDEATKAMQKIDCNVVKIGVLLSTESIKVVLGLLQRNAQLKSVIDIEPFFKAGPAPKPELVAALRKDLLPSMTIISATVPEIKALLDEAGIPVDYPKNMQDVVSMANTLRTLGPEYVIVKREIFEEGDKTTTLHFVLCGENMDQPLMAASRFENPKGLFGISYSIPPVIAAYLAKGHPVPEAVSGGFKFVEEMLKGGQYFD